MDFEGFGASCSPPSVTLRFILTVCLLVFVLTPAEGQFQVIASPQVVVAAPGDDIILPCHVEPKFNVANLTVEWSRPDLRPDPNDRLSSVEYVHLYRDSHEFLDMKISSYSRRTALFEDSLQYGNISLKITNVTLEDGGRYRCFIPRLTGQKSSVVVLTVDPNMTKTRTTATPLHPKDLQTPHPTEETGGKGGLSCRHRLVPLVVVCVFLILSVGVLGYLRSVSKSQKAEIVKTLPI